MEAKAGEERNAAGENASTGGLLNLAIGRYRIHFALHNGCGRWPDYEGSAWRGAFGRALRQAVCVTRLPQCAPCLLLHTCPYSYLFETPPPPQATKMRRYPAVPHPFVMDVPWDRPPADRYTLGLSLFGWGNDHLPYAIYALQRAGEGGLTVRRIRLSLEEVEHDADLAGSWSPIYSDGRLAAPPVQPPPIPPAPHSGTIEVIFRSPMRLKHNDDLTGPEEFTFAHLFKPLLRRLSILTSFHGMHPIETDFKGLTERARSVHVLRPELSWFDWGRYSSRQRSSMQMGGLLGSFRLDHAEIEPFWPFLWLGQWTHAGRGTSMGLGRYELSAGGRLRKLASADNALADP